MRLSAKLILVFLVVSLIPTAVVGVTANGAMTDLSESDVEGPAPEGPGEVDEEVDAAADDD